MTYLGGFKVKGHGAIVSPGAVSYSASIDPIVVSTVSVTVFDIFDITAIFPWDASLK